MGMTQGPLDTLRYETYMQYVLNNHPITKQIEFLDKQDDLYSLKAKSIWDPSISSNLDRKTFDDKTYFNKLDFGGELPTPYAAKGVFSYESNNGVFLNPEQSLPTEGLITAGLALPLIRGLLFDERRRILSEVKLLQELNALKQIEMGNKLLADASKAYIEWQLKSEIVQINRSALQLANQRFEAAKSIYDTGDGPAIDTLEAQIDIIERRAMYEQSVMQKQQSVLQLSLFLWGPENELLTLGESVISEPLKIEQLESFYDELKLQIKKQINDLPQVAIIGNSIQQIELEGKMLKEERKPRLDFKWLPLQWDPSGNGNRFNLQNNNKFNLSFEASIINRKARADLQLNQIEREIQNENLRLLKNQVSNKLASIDLELNFYLENIDLLSENVISTQTLLNAERIKFDIGESSIFLLNSRELKLLDARIKKAKTLAKLIIARVNYLLVGRRLY